jgi:hypothetical protein
MPLYQKHKNHASMSILKMNERFIWILAEIAVSLHHQNVKTQ